MSSDSKVVCLNEYKKAMEEKRIAHYEDVVDEEGELYQCGVEGLSLQEDYEFLVSELFAFFAVWNSTDDLPDSYFILVELLYGGIMEIVGENSPSKVSLEKVKKFLDVEKLKIDIMSR